MRSRRATTPGNSRSAGVAVIALVLTFLAAPSAAFAVSPGAIAGAVHSESGATLSGIDVGAYVWDDLMSEWTYSTGSTTDGSGNYEMPGLAPGGYLLEFSNAGGYYVTEWWQDESSQDYADEVSVSGGTTSTADATLTLGGDFSGTVTDESSSPLADISVDAYLVDRWGGAEWRYGGLTSTSGTYGTDALAPGDYLARFSDPSCTYSEEWWDDVPAEADAGYVQVAAGTSLGSIDASLALSGHITGKVTDLTGAPLQNIEVSVLVYDADWDQWISPLPSATTDVNGDYDLSGISSGRYRVSFVDSLSWVYANEYYDDSESVYSAADVTVTAPSTVSSINASLTAFGGISGKVTDMAGVGIDGSYVQAYRLRSDGWEWETQEYLSGGSGIYDFIELRPGCYKVCFDDEYSYPNGGHAGEWWDDQPDMSSADTITVTAGSTSTSIDASLAAFAHITGKVTDLAGAPLRYVRAQVYEYNPDNGSVFGGWDTVADGQTDASGDYNIGQLRAGTYRVRFDTHADSRVASYTTEVFNDQPTLDTGQDVTVTLDATRSSINASLSVGGRITGTVRSSEGSAVAGARVRVYRADGHGDWESLGYDDTDALGRYDLTGLDTGSHRVEFDPSGNCAGETWNDRPDVDSGNDVFVTRGSITPGIDATLTTMGWITGTVRDESGAALQYMSVEAYRLTSHWGWEWAESGSTNASGTYTIPLLDDGTYRVEFSDYWDYVYATEYWDDKGSLGAADDVIVTRGHQTPGIDATLTAVGSAVSGLTGTVRNSTGAPILFAEVTAYEPDGWGGWDYVNDAYADRFGRYELYVPDGQYKVEFTDHEYAPECFDDAPDLDAADTVTVAPAAMTPGVDATLGAGARIQGAVAFDEGAPTDVEVDIDAYAPDGSGGWDYVLGDMVIGPGDYEIIGLPAGDYKVTFYPWAEYIEECFDDATDLDSGATVTVSAGGVASGVDATLTPFGHIKGMVTDTSGLPLKDINVRAWVLPDPGDAMGEEWLFESRTDTSGHYDLDWCQQPVYRVEFLDRSGAHVSEFYSDKLDPYSADPVAIAKGATVSGIDASLTAAPAHIAGRVTNGTGGVGNVWVSALRSIGGTWTEMGYAITDHAGAYSVHGLAAGTYRVRFAEGHPTYAHRFWNAARSLNAASNVVLGATDVNGINATLTLNGAPVAANDSYSAAPDATLTVAAAGVLANDTEPDSETLSAELATGPAHGTLWLAEDGSFKYRPAGGYTGADSFAYRASDGRLSDLATVTLNVSAGDPPVAVNNSYSVAEDATLTVAATGVLGNDSDPNADPLTAVKYDEPHHGTVTLNANGGFVYRPAPNYNGSDHFCYQAYDGGLYSNIATVTFTVTPVNDVPVAVAHSYDATEDVQVVVGAPGVLTGCTAVDTSTPRAYKVAGPSHGTATVNTDGSFVYTPTANYSGADAFTYRVHDGDQYSAAATVTITVAAVNDAPVAVDDSYSARINTTLTVPAAGVLANDTDADLDILSATVLLPPAHGTLNLNANGSFDYRPADAYTGPDGFTYTVSDGSLTDTAAVTLSVTVGSPPVAVNDSYTVAEDGTRTVVAPGVLTNDSDPDSDTLTASRFDDPHNGTLLFDADGSLTYHPNADFNGSDHVRYRAYDGFNYSNIATVTFTVTPVNDVPIAVAHSYDATEDVQLVIGAPGVLAGCTAGDTTTPRAYKVAGPSHGTATVNTDGSFVYTPTANYSGADAFTYRIHDGDQYSAAATVTITVAAVNDVPVASSDTTTVAEDTTLTINAPGFMRNDTDADGDTLVIASWDSAQHGTLMLWADGHGTYRPAPDFFGTDTFRYSCKDPDNAESQMVTVTVTVTSVNDLPTVQDLDYGTLEDTTLTVTAGQSLRTLGASDVETTRTALLIYVYSGPSHGTLSLDTSGSFRYKPNADWNGEDYFRYKAKDGNGAYSIPATAHISVQPVQDAPVAVNDSYTTALDTTLVVDPPGIMSNDSDADGDSFSVVLPLVTDVMSGTLTPAMSPGGGFTYVPASGFSGTDRFSYKVSDGTSESAVATVTITVGARKVTRVSSGDRYGVAAEMARKGWRNADGSWDCTHVIVACGEDKAAADPLAAAGVAGVYDAPILLTKSASLPSGTKGVIGQIAARNPNLRVHLVGGTVSLPDARWTEIRRIAGVSAVKDRIAGSTRYDVTANLAKRMCSVVGSANIDGVIVICSENPAAFFDALAASPISFDEHFPMLGVKKSSVPGSVGTVLNSATYLRGKPRYAASGTGYLVAGGPYAERLATTTNRYAAATQIADKAMSYVWLGCADTGIAAKLPDSLGGGAFMGKRGGVMLYTTTTADIQTTTKSWIDAHKNSIMDGWIFGGTASVPSGQETRFNSILP